MTGEVGPAFRAAVTRAIELGAHRPGAAVGAALIGAVAAIRWVFPASTRAVVIDEWAYLKATRGLGRASVFGPDPTAVAPDLIPVILSAAIARLVGNELAWLRTASAVSFVAMGVLAYLIAVELGAGRRWAVACGIAAVVNPVAMPLAVTGMSDLPGAALLWAACLLGLKYFERPSTASLLGCCLLSVAAASTRPPGAIPVTVLTVLALFGVTAARRYRAGVFAGVTTLAAVGIGIAAYSGGTSSTVHYLKEAIDAPWGVWAKMMLLYPLQVGLYIALAAIPISAGVVAANRGRRRLRGAALLGGVVGMVGAALSKPGVLEFPYMAWGSVAAPNGIGGGDRQQLPSALLVLISILVGSSLGVLIASVFDRGDAEAAGWSRPVRGLASAIRHPTPRTFVAGVVVLLLGVGAVMGFAFDDGRTGYDRYLIPLFGPGIALASSKISGRKIHLPALAATSLVVAGAVVVGVQDWYAHRRATWSELEALKSNGVPATKIDGGFEWSAYHQPVDYAPTFDARDNVPWYIKEFAPSTDREYVLSSSVLEGYVVIGTVRWESWIRAGELYLQRRASRDRPRPLPHS